MRKKTFDPLYGFYHILLDKYLKSELKCKLRNNSDDAGLAEKDELFQYQENNNPERPQLLPNLHHVLNEEELDPSLNEIKRFLASRRHTFAEIPPPIFTPQSSEEKSGSVVLSEVPEIMCRSPTPPGLDTKQVLYKEHFLPRPAVLQVRAQFDRRASDTATLQSSIAQFHALRNAQKPVRYPNRQDDSSGGSTQSSVEQLRVPVVNEDDSGSDQEPDMEAVARYLRGRGRHQRHTISSTMDTPTLIPEPEALLSFHSKRVPALTPTRERERASPVPYGHSVLLPPTDGRPRYGRRASAEGTFSLTKMQIDRQGDEGRTSFRDLQEEHKRLLLSHNSRATEQQSGRIQRRSQSQKQSRGDRKRDSGLRHSYPKYDEHSASFDEATGKPVEEESTRQDLDEFPLSPQDLELLQKQQQEREMLQQEQLMQHRLLLIQQQEETKELIRRASGGQPTLGASIEQFLRLHGLSTSDDGPPSNDEMHLEDPATSSFHPQAPEQLQEKMQQLNIAPMPPVPPFIPVPGSCSPVIAPTSSQLAFSSPFSRLNQPAYHTDSMTEGSEPVRHSRQGSAPVIPAELEAYMESNREMEVEDTNPGAHSNANEIQPTVPFPFANALVHPLFGGNGTPPPSVPGARGHTNLSASNPLSARLGMPNMQQQNMFPPPRFPDLDSNHPNYWASYPYNSIGDSTSRSEPGKSTVVISNNNEVVLSEKDLNPLRSALSVNMSSQKEIPYIVSELQRVLNNHRSTGLDYNQSDSYFSLFGNGVQMEIEVYKLPGGTLNGVKLRRVDGDVWHYRKLCNELLSGIQL